MRRYLYAAAFFAALASGSAACAEHVDFTARPDAAAGKIAEEAYGRDIADAKAAGSSVTIWSGKIDLNGDGKPEIAGQLDSAYLCGGQGPCFFVVSSEGQLMFSVPGVNGMEVLEMSTNGWRDLRFDGQTVWKYNGKQYQ